MVIYCVIGIEKNLTFWTLNAFGVINKQENGFEDFIIHRKRKYPIAYIFEYLTKLKVFKNCL